MYDYKKIFFLAALFSTGSPFVLRTTHTNVVPKLSVRCHCENFENSECSMDRLIRIEILKQNDFGNWASFVEISEPKNLSVRLSQCFGTDFVASGHLGTPGESFLSVTWSTASEDIVGSYQCEVHGYSENITSDVHLTTQTVTIASSLPTTTNPVDNVPEVSYWPEGVYSLLSSVSGCPNTPHTTMVSAVKNFTTTTEKDQHHSLSNPTHLHPDVFARSSSLNIFRFRFCSQTYPEYQAVPWPKGSYCLHCYKWHDCPPDFDYASIQTYLKSSSALKETDDEYKYSFIEVNSDNAVFTFCCRGDGDPNVPVLLPTNKPFYLYRYQGKCQEVRNMDVSDEWIRINTGSQGRHDSIKPDTELTIRLCYYTKRK